MNTWQDIGRCICFIDTCHQLGENIIPREYSRTELLDIRVNIRNYQKNCHAHHQVEDQLEIFSFIFI